MVAKWPIREGLLMYLEILREDAKQNYFQDLQLYGAGLLKSAPKRPEILNE